MATITLNVPNAVAPRVLDVIAARHGYTGFLANGITPQTKTAFFIAYLEKHIRSEMKSHEGATIATNAVRANDIDIDTNIIIT